MTCLTVFHWDFLVGRVPFFVVAVGCAYFSLVCYIGIVHINIG